MKRILIALLVAVGLAASPAEAAKPQPSGWIRLNESGPFVIGDKITFSTHVNGLRGSEWPMVYVECVDAAGAVLYGEMGNPATVFVLGGGWSPWRDTPSTDAVCHGELLYFNIKFLSRTLDTTPPFAVSGA